LLRGFQSTTCIVDLVEKTSRMPNESQPNQLLLGTTTTALQSSKVCIPLSKKSKHCRCWGIRCNRKVDRKPHCIFRRWAAAREKEKATEIRCSSHCSCMGSRCNRPEAHTSLSSFLTMAASGPAVWVPGSWALALGSASLGPAWGLGRGLIPGKASSPM